MPARHRKKPTRPLHAIAFSAAFACTSVPPADAQALLQNLPARTSPDHLTLRLRALGLSDPSIARALFALSNINRTPTVPHRNLLLSYAVLHRLAGADPSDPARFRPAAEDAVWLAFCAAAHTPSAHALAFDDWISWASTFCEALAAADSLPTPFALASSRAAWRAAALLPWSSHLSFPRFLCALRIYDAGFVVALRALAVILVDALHFSKPPAARVSAPVILCPDLGAEGHLLSQYIANSISRIASRVDSGRLSDKPDRSELQLIITEPTSLNNSTSTLIIPPISSPDFLQSSATSPEASSFGHSTTNSADETSLNNNSLEESPTLSSQRRKYNTFSQDGTNSFNAIPLLDNETPSCSPSTPPPFTGPLSISDKARRSKQCSRSKSPFHIDYNSISLSEHLGSGAVGDVYRGTYLLSPVAVKVFNVNLPEGLPTKIEEAKRSSDDPGALNRVRTMNALERFASIDSSNKYRDFVREVEMMSVVRHPNLVLYMGACANPETPLCIVSEVFTGGSLHEYLHTDEDFIPPLKYAMSFAMNIARGMHYLHSSTPSILHCDLKSRNILMSGRSDGNGAPHVVICDFGLCKLFGEQGEASDGMIGTAAYTSPDVISGARHEMSDDVYSFAVLMHEIFTARPPYKSMRAMQVMCQVAEQDLRPSNDRDNQIPGPVRDLIEECWHAERGQRPTFEAVITRLGEFTQSTPEMASTVCCS